MIKESSELTRDLIFDFYKITSIQATINCSWRLMKYCEGHAKQQVYREIKGEIAEVVLELLLCEMQKVVQRSIVLKGLCIEFVNSNGTTEMDLVFITPFKIYMFECKSYKNNPKITKECLIAGCTDVKRQSDLHVIGLNQYLGGQYDRTLGVKPYKEILFEMSSEGMRDERDDYWKKKIPVLNPNNFILEFGRTLREDRAKASDLWNVEEIAKILKPLARKSDKTFEKHMKHYAKK